MNTPAEDMHALLVTGGYGYDLTDDPPVPGLLTFGLAKFQQPKKPIRVVTLLDIGGVVDDIFFDKQVIEKEEVQVRARSYAYKEGWQKLRDIKNYLDGLGKTLIVGGGYRYEGFFALTSILPLGKDADNHFVFTITYNALRFPST